MTYLHGSPVKLEVGDILLPGQNIGQNTNGGQGDAVYLVLTQGYSLSDCEDTYGASNTREYAVLESAYWAGDEGYVYEVEPLGNIKADMNYDVSPACVKTSSARIAARHSVLDLKVLGGLSG